MWYNSYIIGSCSYIIIYKKIEGSEIMAIYIIVAIILLIGGYIIVCYNNFVKLDNQVDEAFSTMDIYLKMGFNS